MMSMCVLGGGGGVIEVREGLGGGLECWFEFALCSGLC